GIDGPKMMEEFKEQAERFDTEVNIGMITEAKFSTKKGGIHKVCVDNKEWIEAEAVIIASGATAKYLGLPSEQKLRGGGVSACAVCDGFFYKDQEVAVVGGGDTACEDASYLANICKKVTMLIRRDEMRASKAMQHRVEKIENIDIRYFTEAEEVLGENTVEGLKIINNQTKETEELKISGFFLAIG